MSRLLYYPGFEISDKAWLKFALLYLDNIDTIVPYSAEGDLSKQHRYVMENTDLLGTYDPTYEESEKATDDAIEALDKVMNDPIRYWRRFGNVKFLDYWRDIRTHIFEIYEEKFTYSFMQFCKTNGFCTKTSKGIKVPFQLGLMYMSLLAYSIRDNKEKDIISDITYIRKLRSITDKTWRKNETQEGITAIKSLIELEVPGELSKIPINKLIELRNKPSFRKKLSAFHSVINKYDNIKEMDSFNVHEITKELNYHVLDIGADILVNFGTALCSVTLGTYIAIQDSYLTLPMIKELLGVGAVVGGGIQIYQGVTKLNEKRLAKSYLTELGKL